VLDVAPEELRANSQLGPTSGLSEHFVPHRKVDGSLDSLSAAGVFLQGLLQGLHRHTIGCSSQLNSCIGTAGSNLGEWEQAMRSSTASAEHRFHYLARASRWSLRAGFPRCSQAIRLQQGQ